MLIKQFNLMKLITAFVMLFSMLGCKNNNSDYEKVLLDASWEYNYSDIEELSNNSDIIAVINIDEFEIDDSYSGLDIIMTKYNASIQELIYGDYEEEIEIIMTGGFDEDEKIIYEIVDDPLMNINDEYLIFAKKNNDGTYRILSGSQGRYVIENNEIYSLNCYDEQVQNSNNSTNIVINGEDKASFINEILNSIY